MEVTVQDITVKIGPSHIQKKGFRELYDLKVFFCDIQHFFHVNMSWEPYIVKLKLPREEREERNSQIHMQETDHKTLPERLRL